MKKLLCLVMGGAVCALVAADYADSAAAIIQAIDMSDPVIVQVLQEEKEREQRLIRLSELLKKPENYSCVGGNDLKLMFIYRKELQRMLVSTDGGKNFLGYSFPHTALLTGAHMVSMSFRRVIDGEKALDELFVKFNKKRFLIKDKEIAMYFNREKQTWTQGTQESVHIASDRAYCYEDLIS